MKRLLSLLLSLSIALLVCGCQISPEQPSQPSDPSTAATQPVLETPPELTAVVLAPVLEQTFAADGVLLCTVGYQKPSIYVTDIANASLIYEDLMTRIESRKTESKDILAMANELYSPDDLWQLYTYECLYTPARLDSRVISLSGKSSSYAGGTHPFLWLLSVTYDSATGKVLDLTDILESAAGLDAMCQYVLNALSNLGEDYYLYSDYVQVVTDRFTPGGAGYGSWYLTGTGLSFYFSTYEIAPYAAGDIVIEVPYEELGGILKDAYFPEGTVSASGELAIAENTGAQFTQSISVKLDPEGTQVTLSPSGTVADVTIQQGSWSEDGTIFFVDSTLLFANRLTQQDAIVVTADLDQASILRISYCTGGQTRTCFLTMQDGVPALTAAQK